MPLAKEELGPYGRARIFHSPNTSIRIRMAIASACVLALIMNPHLRKEFADCGGELLVGRNVGGPVWFLWHWFCELEGRKLGMTGGMTCALVTDVRSG